MTRNEAIMDLHANGMTYGEIADYLALAFPGITRGAVAGVVSRNRKSGGVKGSIAYRSRREGIAWHTAKMISEFETMTEADIEKILDDAFAAANVELYVPSEIRKERASRRYKKIKRMYEDGLSQTKIAKIVGLSQPRVSRILSQGDVQ